MTEIQMALILGTIWIVPSLNKNYCEVIGVGFFTIAAIKGLGWL